MKRLPALLGAAALLTIMPATPALADGTIGEDGLCYAGVPNGSGGYMPGGLVAGTYFSRTTKSGITNFTCKFDLSDAMTPPKHVKTSDFPCFVSLGGGVLETADDQRINVSPGGKMTMVCTIRP
jgi:hypothetical protein